MKRLHKPAERHGLIVGGPTPTYNIWIAMKSRCNQANGTNYAGYGGRGIKVCKRWAESYKAFLEDMGERPKGKSIDRINNDGDYEPGNCRWATPKEQQNNRRNNVMVEFCGERLSVIQWAARFGVPESVLRGRLKLGWPMDRATTEAVRLNRCERVMSVCEVCHAEILVTPRQAARGQGRLCSRACQGRLTQRIRKQIRKTNREIKERVA